MEPVTHLLTGACLARTGFHRRVAYATVAMTIAAELPDIDTLWSLRGPVSGFEHHRGITHTFLGIPFEAAFLLLLFFLWSTWRVRKHSSAALPGSLARVPLGWGALYGVILLALLSHLALDYTNNYGLRPFLPFNDRWYAASLVFIFDPLLFCFLVGGLILPSLFRLVSREVGAADGGFTNSAWARAALTAVLLLWAVRAYENGKAIGLASQSTIRAPAQPEIGDEPSPVQDNSSASMAPSHAENPAVAEQRERVLLQPMRASASPDPLSVFRWYTVTDFGPAIQMGTADARLGTLIPERLLVKPAETTTLRAAKQSRLGKIYLNWSPVPYLTIESNETGTTGIGGSTVSFQDPRFMAATPILHRSGPPPLAGTVVLYADGSVAQEGMDGRFGR